MKRIRMDRAQPPVTLGVARIINNTVDELMTRAFADRLGRSWYNANTGLSKRNIYESLGYIKELKFNDFNARFKRGDIAKRIITAPVNASWRLKPAISEIKPRDNKKDTVFEKAWKELTKGINVFHYLTRADKISGIGEYGVVMLGFDDASTEEELKEPVTPSSGRKLLYMMPYTQANAQIQYWDEDISSERFGMPDVYQVTISSNFREKRSRSILVHHSRILHLAEETTENDVYGTPRLEAVFNRLQDLELVVGGSGEMFWRGALPGFNFKLDPEADVATIDTDDLKDQIEKYVHGLQRMLRTQGVEVQAIAPQVASPKEHAEVQLQAISGTTGIPVRILVGSERGELASSQDESNWLTRVDERREDYVEPMILRPFIDRMIMAGVLSEPKEGYSIAWPSLLTPAPKERAEIASSKSQALATYVGAMGADQVVPPEIFLRDFLEYDDDRIDDIERMLEGMVDGEVQQQEQEELRQTIEQIVRQVVGESESANRRVVA